MSASLVIAILSLLIALASIVLRYWETPPEVLRRVVQLEIDLQESIDTMARWIKRENVRRARDEKEEKAAAQPEQNLTSGPLDAARRKAMLREKARTRGLM